jgi:hypothetical protein
MTTGKWAGGVTTSNWRSRDGNVQIFCIFGAARRIQRVLQRMMDEPVAGAVSI